NQHVVLCEVDGKAQETVLTNLYKYSGLSRVAVDSEEVGEIIAVSGVEGINIGDTICNVDSPKPLPFAKISEPTVSMLFSVNDSPFAGREGTYVTSRNIRERLLREIKTDVSLKVEETESPDTFKVS